MRIHLEESRPTFCKAGTGRVGPGRSLDPVCSIRSSAQLCTEDCGPDALLVRAGGGHRLGATCRARELADDFARRGPGNRATEGCQQTHVLGDSGATMIGYAAKSTFESRRGHARPRNSVVQPANREPDGATRAALARNSGVPCASTRVSQTPGPGFRDLTCEAAAAGRMAAEFA